MAQIQAESTAERTWYAENYEFTANSIYQGLVKLTIPLCPQRLEEIKQDAREVAESVMLLLTDGGYTGGHEKEDVSSVVACFQSKYDPHFNDKLWSVKKTAEPHPQRGTYLPSIEEQSAGAKRLLCPSDNTSRYESEYFDSSWVSVMPGSMVVHNRITYRTLKEEHGGNEIGVWWMTDTGTAYEYVSHVDRQWKKRSPVDLAEVAKEEKDA